MTGIRGVWRADRRVCLNMTHDVIDRGGHSGPPSRWRTRSTGLEIRHGRHGPHGRHGVETKAAKDVAAYGKK